MISWYFFLLSVTFIAMPLYMTVGSNSIGLETWLFSLTLMALFNIYWYL